MRLSPKYLWLPALPLFFPLSGTAETVYKSVDDNGVVVFSDTRPAEDVSVETLVIDATAPQPTEQEQQRLEDMRETTDKMVADRMAREKHRAEMDQLQAQRAAEQTASTFPDYYQSTTVYTGAYNYPARRHWRHPHRPRPGHPIRPPLQPLPPGPVLQPGHDYPASLIRNSYDPKVRAALR